MDGNVGLFDCVAATEWVSKYIGYFGGDKNRVTASGQSSGAGILYYMSTLYCGRGNLPFQRVGMRIPSRTIHLLRIDQIRCSFLRPPRHRDVMLSNDRRSCTKWF
jgi:acetyl esterase/lipase